MKAQLKESSPVSASASYDLLRLPDTLLEQAAEKAPAAPSLHEDTQRSARDIIWQDETPHLVGHILSTQPL